MNRHITALILPVTLAAFALTGCGGGDAPKETTSPSASATSASPSASRSATPSATSTPAATPASTETAAEAEAAPTNAAAPAGDDEVQQFFQTGGQCISDVWSSSMPHTDALQQKVIDYCAANQLGDWAHGVDPMDPQNYGGGQSEPAEKSAATREEEIAKCQALDINTATSGAIQYCYMEYGIDVHGAPAYDPGATPDVAGPSTP